MIENAPRDPQAWEIVSKTLIWLVVGMLIAWLVAILIMAFGSESFLISAKSLLPFVLMTIAFVATLVGVGMVVTGYHIFFPKVYNDFGKMMAFSFVINTILFFVFALIYFFANTPTLWWTPNAMTIYLVLGFHICFAVFLSLCAVDMHLNPQYSWSVLVWSSIGFGLTIVVLMLVYMSTVSSEQSTRLYYLMLMPSVLIFLIMPLIQSIWYKIYYTMYELGSNFLYLYTIDEQLQIEETKREENEMLDDINVEQ